MKVAYLLKDNQLSSFPSDLYIDNKKIKYGDFFLSLSENNVKVVVAKHIPCDVISKLRQKGIVFFKASSLEDIENLDFYLNKEEKIKRGWGCQRKFK